MLALVPFLSAHPGEVIITDVFPEPVIVAVGFLFVATGNGDIERGRIRLPEYVKSLLCTVQV
jgi:hypothetical protein